MRASLTPVCKLPPKVLPGIWHNHHRQDQFQLLQTSFPFPLRIRFFFRIYITAVYRRGKGIDLVLIVRRFRGSILDDVRVGSRHCGRWGCRFRKEEAQKALPPAAPMHWDSWKVWRWERGFSGLVKIHVESRNAVLGKLKLPTTTNYPKPAARDSPFDSPIQEIFKSEREYFNFSNKPQPHNLTFRIKATEKS